MVGRDFSGVRSCTGTRPGSSICCFFARDFAVSYLGSRHRRIPSLHKILRPTDISVAPGFVHKSHHLVVFFGGQLPSFFFPQKPPPKVLLLCRSWGACVPRRSQRLCQLEFWLLVGTTMLDRLWARGQTKCNTPLMLATSVFGRIHRQPCYVMAQPTSRLDIPWPNDAECMGHVWYRFSCWYPLLFDIESLAGCVGG